jgi:thioredoxin-related protein
LTPFIFANELKTVDTYQEALKIAKQENKIILFMTSIEGCPVCDYMKDIVFEKEEVINFLDKNYVVVIKDAETQIYPQKFYTRDMPTFYFIDPTDEKEIRAPKVGGSTPEKFLTVLENVINTDINSTNQTKKGKEE